MNYRPVVRFTHYGTETSNQPEGDGYHVCWHDWNQRESLMKF